MTTDRERLVALLNALDASETTLQRDVSAGKAVQAIGVSVAIRIARAMTLTSSATAI